MKGNLKGYTVTGFALAALLTTGLMPSMAEESVPELGQAVKAYRAGQYAQAQALLQPLHAQQPEDLKATYYLAMTEAQLGHFGKARQLYGELVSLDPNGSLGQLARQGLGYLPKEEELDPPPKFQVQTTEMEPTPEKAAAIPPSSGQSAGLQPGAQASTLLPNGMSPQDMMALQAIFSGGNGGGYSPLPYMMMPNGTNGAPNIDPNVMSTMLMNQMMQNFSLGGDKDKD